MKVQFVNVKIVIYGIQSHQHVKNHQFHNVHSLSIANRTKHAKLMCLVFSNVFQSVQKSIVQHSQFVSQEAMKEVVNVYPVIKEIQMIEMDVHQIEEINVQATLNVPNLKCAFDNKEYQNVFQLVIAFVVVQTLHALQIITTQNVNVHLEILSAIQMISAKDVNKSTVSIILIVHQLNIAIVWTINATMFACMIRVVTTPYA